MAQTNNKRSGCSCNARLISSTKDRYNFFFYFFYLIVDRAECGSTREAGSGKKVEKGVGTLRGVRERDREQ